MKFVTSDLVSAMHQFRLCPLAVCPSFVQLPLQKLSSKFLSYRTKKKKSWDSHSSYLHWVHTESTPHIAYLSQ